MNKAMQKFRISNALRIMNEFVMKISPKLKRVPPAIAPSASIPYILKISLDFLSDEYTTPNKLNNIPEIRQKGRRRTNEPIRICIGLIIIPGGKT
jgi:hypothetical protein